ncbi:MAG: class II aldolase/adducin family protein [Nocardiopsaceae bacterium]|jgi:ribulose-5-phosphate 4-epimerase/fuculose-1-phosphate aldolase|nr:class II aldolase/adducin family protein [Nocardiopsaceae bacterium]
MGKPPDLAGLPGGAELERQRREVALACRVLAHAGLAADVLGHVSVRIGSDAMLIRCRGPQERGLLFTDPEDVHVVGLDPSATLIPGYAAPSELPIHAETLRARPGVNAVVHAHPPAVVAADLAGLALRPVIGAYNIPAMRMASDGIPVYPRGVLIRRAGLAAEMLAAMGDAPVCVLRGHGVTTTGASIAEATVRALNLEALARMILSAAQAGGRPADLPYADIAELPDLGAALNTENVWRYHLARLDHAGLGLAREPGAS